jgi:hypothetical protein
VDNTNSTTVTNSTTPDDNTNTLPDDNSVDDTGDNNEPSYPPITSFSSTSVSEALSDNIDDHDDSGDYVWSSSQVVSITLDGNTISADNSAGLVISGSTVTIKSAGTYSISGTLRNGQVVVDTDDTQVVRLILNGVSINCNSNSPLYVKKAEKTVLILADGKENYHTDTANNQDDAALLSKDDHNHLRW